MPGIDQHARLRPGGASQQQRHAPVGDIGMVERRLEGLVLDQQALVGTQRVMRALQPFRHPAFAGADVGGAGKVRAVREPGRDIARADLARNPHRVQDVLERAPPHRFLLVRQRPVLVDLVLEHVGTDRARPHAVALGDLLDVRRFRSFRDVPQHVQRHRGTRAGDFVDLARVRKFFLGGPRRGLMEFAEPRPRVRESPRRQLDLEAVESRADGFRQGRRRFVRHGCCLLSRSGCRQCRAPKTARQQPN